MVMEEERAPEKEEGVRIVCVWCEPRRLQVAMAGNLAGDPRENLQMIAPCHRAFHGKHRPGRRVHVVLEWVAAFGAACDTNRHVD